MDLGSCPRHPDRVGPDPHGAWHPDWDRVPGRGSDLPRRPLGPRAEHRRLALGQCGLGVGMFGLSLVGTAATLLVLVGLRILYAVLPRSRSLRLTVVARGDAAGPVWNHLHLLLVDK